jgi:hypothetical protein
MLLDRLPTETELELIEKLIVKANIFYSDEWKSTLLVRPYNDDGMGSLLLIPMGIEKIERSFGKTVSEIQFNDIDGVNILVSLNLDSENRLYELDIWKVDFSPVQNLRLK